jgi:hypothetical protein
MSTLPASGARDSLCTIEPTFSAELSTMLLRLASVGPLRSIMDNVGNGIRREPAFEVLFSASSIYEWSCAQRVRANQIIYGFRRGLIPGEIGARLLQIYFDSECRVDIVLVAGKFPRCRVPPLPHHLVGTFMRGRASGARTRRYVRR